MALFICKISQIHFHAPLKRKSRVFKFPEIQELRIQVLRDVKPYNSVKKVTDVSKES
jgi:hypothetical protein